MKRLLSIVLLFSIIACSSQKEVYVDNPQILSFGSMGGFTNQNTIFKLKSDGELWKYISFDQDSILVAQLKKSQTRKLFEEAYKIGLDTLDLNSPGNMSSFIQIESKTMENKVVWPKDNEQMQTEITDLYSTLIHYTKAN